MNCPNCGNTLSVQAKFCNKCGCRINNGAAAVPAPNSSVINNGAVAVPTPNSSVTVVNNYALEKNTAATVGLVFAIISIFSGFIPIPFLGVITWLVGVICSIVGLFKEPRGKAIAAMIISFFDIILIVFVLGALGIGVASLGLF